MEQVDVSAETFIKSSINPEDNLKAQKSKCAISVVLLGLTEKVYSQQRKNIMK